MRKRLIITAYLVGMAVCLGSHAQKTLNLPTLITADEIAATSPTRDIEIVKDGVVVTYQFESITILDDPMFPRTSFLRIEGFGENETEGEPAILQRMDTFTVPQGYTAHVTIVDSAYVEYPLLLSPARPERFHGENYKYTKEDITPIKAYTGLFPKSIIPTVTDDCYRHYPLKQVWLAPVQYDYEHGTIRAYTMIKYKVTFKVDEDRVVSTGTLEEHYDEDDVIFLNNITLNGVKSSENQFLSSSEKLQTRATLYKKSYLIITVPKYSSAINNFVAWKRMMGFTVYVKTQNSWTPSQVKTVVRGAYNTYDNLRHLLIVGDMNDVPGELKYDGSTPFYTDFYYGCLYDTNQYASIRRGRIPVSTESEASTVLAKIIKYERNPVTDETFYNKGLHCSYYQDEDYDSHEDRRFVRTSEQIRNYLYLFAGKNIDRVYYAQSGVTPTYYNNGVYSYGELLPDELRYNFNWNGNASMIQGAINQGAFYVLYRDHGVYNEWTHPTFSTSDVAQLNNGEKLPVIFSICCKVGNYANNSLAEAFLKKGNGGCVGIFAATEETYSGKNDVLAGGMFDAIWPSPGLKPIIPSGQGSYSTTTNNAVYELGQILDQGLCRVREIYPSTARITLEKYHCFGDPSMKIRTAKPTAFENASVVRSSSGIYVNPGESNCTIAYSNSSTGVTEYWNSSPGSLPDDPNIIVSITGTNKIPYIDANGIEYIQNRTFDDPFKVIQGFFFKIGASVNENEPFGNVVFDSGDTYIYGTKFELHPGTTVNEGASVDFIINKTPWNY